MIAYPCLSTASNQYHSATANSSTSKRTPIHRSVRIREIKRANLFSRKRHVIRQQCNTSKTCSVSNKNKNNYIEFTVLLEVWAWAFQAFQASVDLQNAESEFSFPFAWLKHAQGCLRMLKASRHSALGPQWIVGNSCEWRACIVHSE